MFNSFVTVCFNCNFLNVAAPTFKPEIRLRAQKSSSDKRANQMSVKLLWYQIVCSCHPSDRVVLFPVSSRNTVNAQPCNGPVYNIVSLIPGKVFFLLILKTLIISASSQHITQISTRAHTHTRIHSHTHTYTRTHTHTRAHTHTHTHTQTYAYTCTQIRSYIHTHIHTITLTHTNYN